VNARCQLHATPAFERPKKLLMSDFLNNDPPGEDQEAKDMPVQDLAVVGVPVPPGVSAWCGFVWMVCLHGRYAEDAGPEDPRRPGPSPLTPGLPIVLRSCQELAGPKQSTGPNGVGGT